MLKVLLTTLLGLFSSGSGLYLGYLYLNSLSTTSKPLLLVPSLPLTIFGIMLILRASQANERLLINDDQPPVVPPENVDNFKNIAQKNNELVSDWIKESDKRDKLKILEIAAAAEEDAKKAIANSG